MKPKRLSIIADDATPTNGNDSLANHPLFKKSVPTDRQELAEAKPMDLVDFNRTAEKQFVELICFLLADGDLSAKEAIQESCFELNISPITARRYLLKHTARRAEFRIDVDGLVRCKKHQH